MLQFHGIFSECRFYLNVLPKFKFGRRRVASDNWRVVTHLENYVSSYATPKFQCSLRVYLFANVLESFVFPNIFVGFTQQGGKRITYSNVRGTVRRNGKGGNQYHSFIRVLGFRSLVQQFAVLEHLAKTLQHSCM